MWLRKPKRLFQHMHFFLVLGNGLFAYLVKSMDVPKLSVNLKLDLFVI